MSVTLHNPCVAVGGRRGSTDRTRALADAAVGGQYGLFGETRRLAAEAPPAGDVAPILRDALHFAYVHTRLTPLIRPGELIVGARLRDLDGDMGGCWFPDGHDSYVEGFARNTPPDRPDIHADALRGLISPQGSFNHKVVDYAGYVRTGSAALARAARERAAGRTAAEAQFCEAMALGHEAVSLHSRRYAEACLALADQEQGQRRDELVEVARICAKLAEGPAETFHEALQALWFAYMVPGDATGRPDVYLREFYETDLAAGRITPEQAQELVECFLVKLHGDTVEGVINVSSIQTMTLAGLSEDGSDASSELTRIFLRAVQSVKLLRPTVYIRLHEGSPEDLIDLGLEMLGEGLAEPSFYGDRPIIEGLVRIGVPIEQARDYALSGCTEVVSPGRGNWGAPNGWVNMALLADDAIRECATTGGDLWAILSRRTEELADDCRDCNTWVDDQVADTRYAATLFMPCCHEKCLDVAHGGAETYYGHWEGIGLPNAADMLYVAQSMLEQGEDLAALVSAVDAGDPAARSRLARMPHYGNGDARVDAVASRMVALLADALEARSTRLRTALVLGHLAGGENMHIPYGRLMGATLDGRKAGQTLADSLAGSQGRTGAGPTAVIQSLCALDHSRLIAGNVSTIRVSPSDLRDAGTRAKTVALVRAFVAMGGSQLQFNVADAEVLRDAQAHPELHRGLLVRVAGYSADFTAIGRALQDEIIARTEGLG